MNLILTVFSLFVVSLFFLWFFEALLGVVLGRTLVFFMLLALAGHTFFGLTMKALVW